MKLEKYVDKSKKKRKIILISLGVIVLISVSLLLYKTFASFTESAEFPIMNGKVDYFGNSDIYFVFYKNGQLVEEMPKKDNAENIGFDHAECENEASILWNEEAWAPLVKNLKKAKTKCSLYFEKVKYYVSSSGNDNANGDKGTPLKTIKEAYDKIVTRGTIILLNNIEENEGIKFNTKGKEITITSEGSTYEIDRGTSLTEKSILEISNNNNVTLTNIIFNGLRIDSSRALISVSNSSLTLNEGAIIENGINTNRLYPNWGGGILVNNNSTLIMNDGIVQNNKCGEAGGGIDLSDSAFYLNGGEIKNNEAINGAGVDMYRYNTLEMNGGTITANHATNCGGGIHLNSNNFNGSVFNFNSGEITNNIADARGGGLKYAINNGESTLNLRGTNFIGNTANRLGGGIDIENKSILRFDLSAGLIKENTATSDSGGGLMLNTTSDNNIYNITGGTISDNNAKVSGGGIKNLFTSSNNTFNISNVIISGNTAESSGGVCITASSSDFTNNIVNFKSGEITSNTATNNGGIFVEKIKEFNMSIINNKSTEGIGGINVLDTVESYNKTGGTISGNIPTDVGGIATK